MCFLFSLKIFFNDDDDDDDYYYYYYYYYIHTIYIKYLNTNKWSNGKAKLLQMGGVSTTHPKPHFCFCGFLFKPQEHNPYVTDTQSDIQHGTPAAGDREASGSRGRHSCSTPTAVRPPLPPAVPLIVVTAGRTPHRRPKVSSKPSQPSPHRTA